MSEVIYSGYHDDVNMSQVFCDEPKLPRLDVTLEVGSGSHAQQTALSMQRFKPAALDDKSDGVVGPEDVHSMAACALTATRLGTKAVHGEAGVRCLDRAASKEKPVMLKFWTQDEIARRTQDARQT